MVLFDELMAALNLGEQHSQNHPLRWLDLLFKLNLHVTNPSLALVNPV